MPARMMHKEKMDKVVLFTAVCSLPADDPMCLQPIIQKNISFLNATCCKPEGHIPVGGSYQDSRVVAVVESANAAASGLHFT